MFQENKSNSLNDSRRSKRKFWQEKVGWNEANATETGLSTVKNWVSQTVKVVLQREESKDFTEQLISMKEWSMV